MKAFVSGGKKRSTTLRDIPSTGGEDDESEEKAAAILVNMNKTDFQAKRSRKEYESSVKVVEEGRPRRRRCASSSFAVVEPKPHKKPPTVDGNTLEVKDVVATTPRCQPKAVVNVIEKLTHQQRAAVHQIGFGDLLHLKLDELPRDMVRTLCRNFLPSSRILKIGKYEVQLKAADVHDVFGIPYGDLEVPLSGYNDDRDLKVFWRSTYGNGKDVTVPLMFEKMFENDERKSGDNVFKKLFIMYVMSTLFTPSLNRTADFKLVRVLEDVDNFSQYDWCSFVLDHLGSCMVNYSDVRQYVPGCVLFLQICYVQRYMFRGIRSPKTLPLIRHWSYEKLKNRIRDEGDEYGVGFLDTKYPITKVKDDESDVVEGDVVEVDDVEDNVEVAVEREEGITEVGEDVCVDFEGGIAVEIKDEVREQKQDEARFVDDLVDGRATQARSVTFVLPEGILTDEEIAANAKNDPEKNYLQLKRNMKLFGYLFGKNVDSMRVSSSSLSHDSDPMKKKDKSPSLCQLSALPSNASFWNQIDQLTRRVLKIQDELPSFELYR